MKTENVMLAKTWDESTDPTGWWISEKLDGVRAIWNGIDFVSRNNKPIYAPPQWKAGMPQVIDKPLDGELYMGRGNFQKCVSIVRRQNPNLLDWAKIRFMCFDVIDPVKTWLERFRVEPTPCLIPVQHFYCNDLEYMLSMYDQIVAQGGEGLMLRHPDKTYKFTRSEWLLKVKPELELECAVLGHTPGEGKYVDMVGALECSYFDAKRDKVIEFNVGSGLTDADRTPKYAPQPGTKIRIRYQCLTDAGVPRFPRFVERL